MHKVGNTPDDDELLVTSQVAELADTNVATVNRWAKTGKLRVAAKAPGIRGANLYRRGDVDELLRQSAAS
ncbi:MAG: hypothetical protein QOH14_1252 [Pseudonocardiales bacterium]|nr:hypothetical protein [Pseudonocardiales bacterium]